MARGFESKAVTEQQEEAQWERPEPVLAVDPAVQRARKGLELARIDIERRLANAPASAPLRAALEAGLDEIARQMERLPGP